VEVAAEEGDEEEFLAGEEAEVGWDVGEQDGGVHVADVVGADDVGGFGVGVFDADGGHLGSGNTKEHAGPGPGDFELGAAAGVERGAAHAEQPSPRGARIAGARYRTPMR